MIETPVPPSLARTQEATPQVPASLALPLVVNPGAALQAVVEFFEKRGLMTKEEFVDVLRRSQRV